MINIGFAITGSFCTHEKIIETIKNLTKDYNIIPIITPSVKNTSTRFGDNKKFIQTLQDITQNKVITSIIEAEPLGPANKIDILVIAPCTGNTLAKLATGITDNAVLMTAKSHQRNNKPIVVGISTNDALGLNLKNIALLLNSKNFFFVPFFQDSPQSKPKSLVAKWEQLPKTIEEALKNKQIEPIIYSQQGEKNDF